jgi:hypothetical protein
MSWHLSPSQRRTSSPPFTLCVCIPSVVAKQRLGKHFFAAMNTRNNTRIVGRVYLWVLLLLWKISVKTFPRQWRVGGGVVLSVVLVVSKESRRLVLLRTPVESFDALTWGRAVTLKRGDDHAYRDVTRYAGSYYSSGSRLQVQVSTSRLCVCPCCIISLNKSVSSLDAWNSVRGNLMCEQNILNSSLQCFVI